MRQDQRTGQATDRTEDKVQAGGKRRRMYIHSQPLHQNLRCRRIRTDVDPDMAHDTDKHQQDERITQQSNTFGKGRRLPFRRLLLNMRRPQQENSNHGNHHIDREKHTPPHSQRRNSLRRPPHRNIGGQERGDRLDKLPEGQAARQLIPGDNIRQKRIQGSLHQRIPDPQQGERCQHHHIAIAETRDQQRNESDNQTQHNRLLTPDLIHQHPCRDREDQEPEEH